MYKEGLRKGEIESWLTAAKSSSTCSNKSHVKSFCSGVFFCFPGYVFFKYRNVKSLPRFGQLLLWEWSPHRVRSLLLFETAPEYFLYVGHGESTHCWAWDTVETYSNVMSMSEFWISYFCALNWSIQQLTAAITDLFICVVNTPTTEGTPLMLMMSVTDCRTSK